MKALISTINTLLTKMPAEIPILMLRIFPAYVFLASGRTKVDGLFTIKDSTYFLFQYEYDLPLISYKLAAVMATIGEHVLPILLFVGLFTRLSALGLLGMTAVIQIFVYPGAWQLHGVWASCFVALAYIGPGKLSLDNWFKLDQK